MTGRGAFKPDGDASAQQKIELLQLSRDSTQHQYPMMYCYLTRPWFHRVLLINCPPSFRIVQSFLFCWNRKEIIYPHLSFVFSFLFCLLSISCLHELLLIFACLGGNSIYDCMFISIVYKGGRKIPTARKLLSSGEAVVSFPVTCRTPRT